MCIIVYTYDNQGYRTSKTINGVKTSYYLRGDKVLYETNGTYGILYTYNHDGSLIGYKYISSISTPSSYQEFYYVFDSQGDITGIINSSRYLVATYTYDAYGNQTINIPSTYQSTYGTALNANPYTYKGYRYDSEIGMYYLNSRYYNPEIGRFISSDGMLGEVGDVLSTNMYAYTENNPVMNYDPTGYMSDENNAVNEDEPTLARVEGEGFTDPVEEISSDINVEPEKTVNIDKQPSNEIKSPEDYNWPSENYVGERIRYILSTGTIIDRYGYDSGRFTSPEGTPFEMRSLPKAYINLPYTRFLVTKPIEVWKSTIAPWDDPDFESPGGGTQYEFDNPITYYIDNGIIKLE